MRRPAALITKNEEDASDSLSSMGSHSNHAFLDDAASPYFHNTSALSDEECLSDSSKKIRKKRNTYQKIADDIRVHLLEAVQNGETLKAAAKRYKINYSSAKSILHTYRKEGRILKKSAQERTSSKKGSFDFVDTEPTPRPMRSTRKSKIISQDEGEKTKIGRKPSETISNGFSEENSTLSSVVGSNQHLQGTKAEVFENLPNLNDNHRVSAPLQMHSFLKNDDSHYKVSDNYNANFFEYPMSEGADSMFVSHPQNPNYSFLPCEFDSFGEIVTSFKSKPYHNEEFYQDPSAFLCSRNFNMNYEHNDDFIVPGRMEFEQCKEQDRFYPMEGFMDTQRMLREALAKDSFCVNENNKNGNIKDSVDLFF